MKRIIFALPVILLLVTFAGCKKKYEEYAVNPNVPVTAPAYLLLRGVLNDMVVFPDGDEDRWCQFTCRNYTYYGNNEYWNGAASLNYSTLRNILAMEKEAKKASGTDVNPYAALGKFMKAYFFINMTLKVGDLPMTEAMKGLDNPTPKYDSQKQIFIQCLQLLEESNAMLTTLINAADVSLQGDFYFQERIGGGLTPLQALRKWQRVVNAFKLRTLLQLSKKEADTDLNIKHKFSETISNPAKYPLMAGLDDNLQYVYNTAFNKYPNNKDNFGFDALRLNLAATWVNTLSALNDLRVMKVAEPARGLGFPDTDYRSFVGAPSGEDLSNMAAKVQTGKYSLYNRKRYYDGYTGESTFIISYSEMCFNIAEGINRGWVTGDAETWYKNGLWAMMAFYGVADGDNTVTFQRFYGLNASGSPVLGLLGDYVTYTVNFQYATYYNQTTVKYAGNNTNGLAQILVQKYLSFGRNSGLEAYYQWRRTGLPVFSVGAGTGNSNVIPLRFQYPTSERSTNKTNLESALTNQYSGNDNINAKMWLLN